MYFLFNDIKINCERFKLLFDRTNEGIKHNGLCEVDFHMRKDTPQDLIINSVEAGGLLRYKTKIEDVFDLYHT